VDDSSLLKEMIAYAGLVWERGLVAGSSGNLSARLDDGSILVTPTGMSLRDLRKRDIVRVDPDGATLSRGRGATSELPLHLAAYRARPDIGCVIHTHPTYVVAWSKTGSMFPLDTVGATESLGSIAYTAYAPPGSVALADRCADAFRSGARSVVMERHGLSCVSATFEGAFIASDLAEQTARIETTARTLRHAMHCTECG